MKPIIIDYNQMSDSKEVYESKPNPFFAIFIYSLLVATIVAVIWAIVFKVDIVVKGTGIVSAREDSNIVTNTYTGKIINSYIKDGQYVEKGDILYEIEASDLNLQLDDYNNQLVECEERLSAMNSYLEWLNNRDKEMNISKDNPFYDEYMARKQIVLLQLSSSDNQYSNQKKNVNSKLESGENMVEYYNEEINKLKLLSMAIQTRTNPFDTSEAFYYAKVNQYITDYNNTVSRYDNAIDTLKKKIESSNKEIEDANSKINQANDKIANANKEIDNAKSNIASSKNNNSPKVMASAIVVEDVEKVDKLETDITKEVENEETETQEATQESVALFSENDLSVDVAAEQDKITKNESEIVSAKSSKTQAESTKKSYEDNIKTIQQEIKSQELEKKTALTSLETETIASVEASILSHEQSLISLNGTLSETKNSQNSNLLQELNNSKDKVIQSEIQSVSTQISSYKSQNQSIQSKINQVENGKKESVVVSPSSGIINLSQELVAGNYLSGGTIVLTVLPKEENLKIKTYISNKDIAKITENMDVKYEMTAYPSRDYGTLNGKIEFVSPDLKANTEDGSAYYLIESSVDSSNLYNKNGEKAELKVGMYCETKVIVEQKSLMKVFLEKINLVD